MDRQTLQLLVFFWHWLVESMEGRSRNAPKTVETGDGKKSSKGKKSKPADGVWERANRLRALLLVHQFLLLQLEAIFISSADLDLIINE